jgi:hypothetical protein
VHRHPETVQAERQPFRELPGLQANATYTRAGACLCTASVIALGVKAHLTIGRHSGQPHTKTRFSQPPQVDWA